MSQAAFHLNKHSKEATRSSSRSRLKVSKRRPTLSYKWHHSLIFRQTPQLRNHLQPWSLSWNRCRAKSWTLRTSLVLHTTMSSTTPIWMKSCWKVASCSKTTIPSNQLMRDKNSVKLNLAEKEVSVVEALTKQEKLLCTITSLRKVVEDLISLSILASIKLQTSFQRLRELSVASTVTNRAVLPQKSLKRTRLLQNLRWKSTYQLWMERFTLLMMKSLRYRLIVTLIAANLPHSISTSGLEESRHICPKRRRQDLLRDTWKEVASDRHLFKAVILSSELMSETKLEQVESQATAETIKSNIATQAQHSSLGDLICLRKMSKAQSRNLEALSTTT